MNGAARAAAMGLALAAFAGESALAQANPPAYRNATAGGLLRPGVYGRIVFKAKAAPPPVIYEQPVVANEALGPERSPPVYLYVPPGQVRKWKQACAKWSACDQPVFFVRMDQSPSRWGRWRQLREQVALQERD